MSEVNRYKIYCTTDSKMEYVWGTEPPTKCPTNTAHTVDLDSVAIHQTIGESVVRVKEEDIPTGGHFRVETITINSAADETKVVDISWPIPISVLEIVVHPTTGMQMDHVSVNISPNTIIGALTADVAIGATTFNVSPTVTANTAIGYHLCLTDGTNTDACGRVLAIDTTNGTVTMETPTTHAFAAATPTYVTQDIYMMYQHELAVSDTPFHVGGSKIGASYIPANTTIRITYHNSSSTNPKHFVASVEYLY